MNYSCQEELEVIEPLKDHKGEYMTNDREAIEKLIHIAKEYFDKIQELIKAHNALVKEVRAIGKALEGGHSHEVKDPLTNPNLNKK